MTSTRTGSAPPCRGCRAWRSRDRSSSRTSPSAGSRTSAPPARRLSGAPPTPCRAAHPTRRGRWAATRSRPAAVVVRAEDAHEYTDSPRYIKARSFVAGNCSGNADPDYDYTAFPEIEAAAADAYAQAGVTDPRHEIAMAEVHDCFTPAELLIMEDLGFAERGTAWKEVLAGTFDLHGELPVNPDGGLKSFGHPVGASGLRMMFEAWLQLRHQAPEDTQNTNDRADA